MSEKTNIPIINSQPVDTAIRISIVAILAYWSFSIFKPFLIPVIWAIIIAVAIFPLYQKFESFFGEKKKLSIVIFTLIALSLLVVPSFMVASSLIETGKEFADTIQKESFQIPAPPSKVADWPIIGDSLFSLWTSASENLVETLSPYKDEFKMIANWFVSSTASIAGSILQFVISIIIASVFIANANSHKQFSQALFIKLAGETGKDFAELASATMRSVAQGVLGVAFIQATMAGLGLALIGVPFAGVWTAIILLLSIMQLPPILILGPIAVYVFSTAAMVPAVIFLIWSFIVSTSDAFLKPLFLGRGMDIPMLIILIGAIGGMMMNGIIGLFIGAVILAITYQLFIKWLQTEN